MTEEEKLIEKLRRIEELFARPGSDGERVAAAAARDRIRVKIRETEKVDPVVEYRFRLGDEWSRRLFNALLRRYGITPYRYSGQRYTTVMARVSKRFVDETLWPEYQQLVAILEKYFHEVTERVIRETLNSETSEAEERKAPVGLLE